MALDDECSLSSVDLIDQARQQPLPGHPRGLVQSDRNAAIGSRCTARRAGRYVATSTTSASTSGTIRNVTASVDDNPYRRPAIERATPTAATSPIPRPTA